MTGISDIYRSAKRVYYSSLYWFRLLLPWLPAPVAERIQQRLNIDKALLAPTGLKCPALPDFRGHVALENECTTTAPPSKTSSRPWPKDKRWGILLPAIAREADTRECCLAKFQLLARTLKSTCSPKDLPLLNLYFGFDEQDPVYDKNYVEKKTQDDPEPEIYDALRTIFHNVGIRRSCVHFQRFSPGYWGKLCWIWNDLAVQSYKNGDHFIVLLGDDIELRTKHWKAEIETRFEDLAKSRKLPFGFGCVCFRDLAFTQFPTFPVISRLHFEIFSRGAANDGGCYLFPREFVNQHGDPYLFEIYRRWGTSVFAKTELRNTVGGAGEARYKKRDTGVIWRDTLLTTAIEKAANFLKVIPYSVLI